ncbi:recombinase family protein [Paracoccus niistensis]|uniref:Recombinase family protein n=1 Tax=Paracoccus niistensis TaxID=632935 RepID=A0ABV6I793_9RHOB
MTRRVALYVRFSSDRQKMTSLDDQIAQLRAFADGLGWIVGAIYADPEITGRTTRTRPEYNRMIADAKAGLFDVVLAEAIDRLARRTADITDLRDVLEHHEVVVHTKSQGLISPMEAAIYGVMAEQFSRDLGEKTRRGAIGAVSRNLVPAGLAYGYMAVEPSNPGDTNRAVVPEHAAVVVRIFRMFADGMPAKKIAETLNREGVPGPRGKPWQESTIRGHGPRGTGILRNPLYIGVNAYGDVASSLNPESGKRAWRVTGEVAASTIVPQLRIVDQELWDRVAARLEATALKMARDAKSGQPLNRAHRKSYVLSGLLKCGCCGGDYTIRGKARYGCSQAKRGMGCANKVTITAPAVERQVLDSLKRGLLAPERLQQFTDRVAETLRARQAGAGSEEANLKRRLADFDRKISRLLDQLEDGEDDDVADLRQRLRQRKAEREEVLTALAEVAALSREGAHPAPDFAALYTNLVRNLEEALRDPTVVQRAHELLAQIIEEVILTPDPTVQQGLRIEVRGSLARALFKGELRPIGLIRSSMAEIAAAQETSQTSDPVTLTQGQTTSRHVDK